MGALVEKVGWLDCRPVGIDVWTIWMFIWTLWYSGPKKVLGMLEIHPPFWLLLACLAVSFSIVLPIAWCWEAICLWRPSNRFHELTKDSREVQRSVILAMVAGKEGGEGLRINARATNDLAYCPKSLTTFESNIQPWTVWRNGTPGSPF